jgi:hypothetical protein
MIRSALPLACLLLLGGCSYAYELVATVLDGHLAFAVSPDSRRAPECLRLVEVESDEARAAPVPGDDVDLVKAGTVWRQSVAHEDGCKNTFPIIYGTALEGRKQIYDSGGVPDELRGQPAPFVAPKQLQIGAIYTVTTTSGATGYGCGRFRINRDKQIENLGCR